MKNTKNGVVPIISSLKFTLLSLCLLSVSQLLYAEVFTWVDENGKTHYGDRIPEQYKEQADEVEVNVNTMPLKENNDASKDILKTEKKSSSSSRNNYNNQTKAQTCEQQKAAYEASKQCFERCYASQGGGLYGGGVNAAKCSCTDAKKPKC